MDSYMTVKEFSQTKNVINKSRFIASVCSVDHEAESKQFLRQIILQFPDANHHCWAYRIRNGDEEKIQYSDGGEPANSAGPPILRAIQQEDLTNVMVIVSRYFGGIKLGISGLIQAYRETALEGLRGTEKVQKRPLREYIIFNINYQALGAILQSLESQNGQIDSIQYGEKVKIIALFPEKLGDWLNNTVKNLTKGQSAVQTGTIHWKCIQ